MALASVALDSARSYLNDNNAQIWTNTTLLPYLKEAHRDLLLVLFLNGLPVIKEKSAVISVTAVSGVTLTLPSDLIEPIWLKERGSSSESFVSMEETEFEPDTPQVETLRYWCWREETIHLVGATSDRQVQLRYWKSLSTIVDHTSALGFILAETFLGPQAAGYAAGSVGNLTLAGELLWIKDQVPNGVAGGKLDMLLRANVKGMQNLPARRIPYRRHNRSRIFL